MARSHMIYIVTGKYTGHIYAAFTVKHEVIRWLENQRRKDLFGLMVHRFRDAHEFVDETDADEFCD